MLKSPDYNKSEVKLIFEIFGKIIFGLTEEKFKKETEKYLTLFKNLLSYYTMQI
jgi:hypothetical protein